MQKQAPFLFISWVFFFQYMCMSVCSCMRGCVYVYVCAHMCVYVCTHVHMCVHGWVHGCICVISGASQACF